MCVCVYTYIYNQVSILNGRKKQSTSLLIFPLFCALIFNAG